MNENKEEVGAPEIWETGLASIIMGFVLAGVFSLLYLCGVGDFEQWLVTCVIFVGFLGGFGLLLIVIDKVFSPFMDCLIEKWTKNKIK